MPPVGKAGRDGVALDGEPGPVRAVERSRTPEQVRLPGQDAAVRALRAAAKRPVHAYMFVGPPGTGKADAARLFASMLLCANGGDDGCDTCRRVLRGVHPDLVVVEREGAAVSIDQAREVARISARSPVEGGRKVLVLPDLHLARDAVPALLKTIEEPPPSTVFVILAEFVPPELVTVASRCARVDFRPLNERELAAVLEADGVSAERALQLARSSGGRLDRARLLAADPEAEERRRAWESVPATLDGSGATIASMASRLVELLDRSIAPLTAQQAREVEELAEREAAATTAGETGAKAARGAQKAAARELEDRHKREQRRQRTDELRTGLAALAAVYSERSRAGQLPVASAVRAVSLIDQLSADLAYNAGELLALQALLVKLDRLGAEGELTR